MQSDNSLLFRPFHVYTPSVRSIRAIISEIMCSTHLYGGMMYDYANCEAESHIVYETCIMLGD